MGSTTWTREELRAFEMKTAAQHNAPLVGGLYSSRREQERLAEMEIPDLHKPIIDWCKNQVPAVPYINSRPDCPSTIGAGVQDFTIFYQNRVYCIECKSKTGKVDTDQRDWAHLMQAQGFTVHVIRSFQQFLELVR